MQKYRSVTRISFLLFILKACKNLHSIQSWKENYSFQNRMAEKKKKTLRILKIVIFKLIHHLTEDFLQGFEESLKSLEYRLSRFFQV